MANAGRKLQGGGAKFKISAIMIVISLCWPIQVYADEWTSEDTRRELVYAALVIADWRQTQDIARHPDMEEDNELLGERPTNGQINRYFIVANALQFAIAYYLPSDWRRSWQTVGIGFELAFVVNNKQAGLSISF